MINISSYLPLLRGRIPGQLVIQFTNHCNALCPQCGMNKRNSIPRYRLTNDEIKALVDAAAAKGVKAVSFTGGEPLMFLDDVVEYMKYAGRAGIEFIRTGSNGFFFANPDDPGFDDRVKKTADKLASSPIRNLWISIDSGIPSVHEEMRGFPGVVKGIEKAIPIFHERGLYPSANLGLNRNLGGPDCQVLYHGRESCAENYPERLYQELRESLQAFYRQVINMGFTMVNTCYPMSVDEDEQAEASQPSEDLQAVYAATSTDRVVKFDQEEKTLLFKALFETVPEFRSKVRIFSPRANLLALIRQYSQNPEPSYPCRGGIDFFFADCQDGNIYPCGYRGQDNMGQFKDLDLNKIDRNAVCRRCDWECFRDPSELFGPITQLFTQPLELFKKAKRDREFFKIWWEDIQYYQAAEFFNGRKPLKPEKLRKFK